MKHDILTELRYELSIAKDRNDIANSICAKINKLFLADECFLGLFDGTYDKFFICSMVYSTRYVTGKSAFSEDIPISQPVKQKLIGLKSPAVIGLSGKNDNELLHAFFSDRSSEAAEGGLLISLCDGKKLIGFLGLGFGKVIIHKTEDLGFLERIGTELSFAVSAILKGENIIRQEKERSFLLAFSKRVASVRDLTSLGVIISHALKNLLMVKSFLITINNEDQESYRCFLQYHNGLNDSDKKTAFSMDARFPFKGTPANSVLNSEEPVVFDLHNIGELKKDNFPEYKFWIAAGADKILGLRLNVASDNIGIIWLEAGQINSRLLTSVAALISLALSNAVSRELSKWPPANHLKNTLNYDKSKHRQEEYPGPRYEQNEIVGSSPEMQNVFQLIEKVAYTNTTVLLLGETGTGKELVARAVHNNSPRRDCPMIRVNCSSLPASLIESELFGHEKGSFTGALEQKIGKFELANNGTIFLDEIGEMPLEAQAKLLRVLQEREIERIGGKKTIVINVRIIAATNRNLHKEVLDGRFRSDLYYRLNVFPITLPPLRSRQGDIPVLASFFIKKIAKCSGKDILSISDKALQELTAHSWPGNIRELEHVMERCALLSRGGTIKATHLPLEHPVGQSTSVDSVKTIDENEREHIIKVLSLCNGKVFGIGGAADLLRIPASTLNSKIKKLDIKKRSFVNYK